MKNIKKVISFIFLVSLLEGGSSEMTDVKDDSLEVIL